jgi:hypothetical protein
VYSHTQRLQQSTHLHTHALRQLMTPFSRMVDPLLQGTLEMRETLCGRAEFHVFADVVAAFGAAVAGIAGHAYFEGYAVAGGEVDYGRADGGDDARGFVAEG